MLLIVIERFKNGDALPVYRRYQEKGLAHRRDAEDAENAQRRGDRVLFPTRNEGLLLPARSISV
jgi:hypothetical protein